MIDIIISGEVPEIIHFSKLNLIPDMNCRTVNKAIWDEFIKSIADYGYSMYNTPIMAPWALCDMKKEFTLNDLEKFKSIYKKTSDESIRVRLEWVINCYEQLKIKGHKKIWVHFSQC
jgi:hypothetical protein